MNIVADHPYAGCCVRQTDDSWQIVCCACRRWVALLLSQEEAHEARRLHGDVCPARALAEVRR